jgi:hypothetical protein
MQALNSQLNWQDPLSSHSENNHQKFAQSPRTLMPDQPNYSQTYQFPSFLLASQAFEYTICRVVSEKKGCLTCLPTDAVRGGVNLITDSDLLQE